MNYWHILDEARAALEDGRYRDAEHAHDRAYAARAADRRRVFVSEQLPDGLRRAWRRVTRAGGNAGPGRWEQAVAAFETEFRTRAEATLQQTIRRLELGPRDEPETSYDLITAALYLSVASALGTRHLAVAPLVVALFDLLPLTGRLGDRDLITPDLDLDTETRLRVASLARDHLERLDADARDGWAGTVLTLLDAEPETWPGGRESERRWLAAGLADLHGRDVAAILRRWEQVDDAISAESRRHWSRLRRLEILGGCDRHRLPVPRHSAARRLARQLPCEGDEEVPRRCRAALAVMAHRRPRSQPAMGWVSASAVGEEVHAVFWWGAEPRDVAVWRAGDDPGPLHGYLADVGDRVIWHGTAPATATLPGWPDGAGGFALTPYLEAVLEPLLPASGWSDDLARRLALARTGVWRDGWRSDLGHPRLKPPGQDGHFASDQEPLEPALLAGLLWLAVIGRVDEADPALRAGLAEIGRRGDPAAAFLHQCAVLGAPDKQAVDATFEPWTLPLLWTRPDPLTTAHGNVPDATAREDLAGQDVAVVTTGRPGPALAAWGPGSRRWRVVLDRFDRLGLLRRQAREAYGPVTVVPPCGEVHHLGAALRLLEELAAGDAPAGQEMLAICHWIRLVETHNGDLLDHRVWRPRPAGTCPRYDRYAELLGDLPRQPVSAGEMPGDGGWADQYAQRVRRSGLVAGLVDDLPERAPVLDAVWGVFDGSEASWVFLDTAAVHWRIEQRGGGTAVRLHGLLAPRGRRHLSILGGRGLFPDALAGWLDEILAAYGRPYHLSLGDAEPPRLRLAGRGSVPHACLDTMATWQQPLAQVQDAGPETAVLLPGRGPGSAFWQAAAADTFGPVRWRGIRDLETEPASRLVVPLLSSLAPLTSTDPPASDDPASWSRRDEERRQIRRDAVRRAALECGALLACPVGQIDVLDVRWWRLLAPPDLEPAAALAWAGVPAAELIDLARAAGPPPPGLEGWLRDRHPVPGLLAHWPGAPLADGSSLAAEGTRVHAAPANLLWRDLVADLLRAWEAGESGDRLLVVSERPPAGAAAVADHLAAAGVTVPGAGGDEPLAPLIWLRSADLDHLVSSGEGPQGLGRALVLDLDALLPTTGDGSTRGARLLGWLTSGAIARVDLCGGPLSEAWSRFLAVALDADVSDRGGEPGGWSSLRRFAGARLSRTCPQCGHRGAGDVDGTVCAGCGLDLAGAAPLVTETEAARERARQLLVQADLGRETALEIWDRPAGLAAVREELRIAGAEPDASIGDGWRLPDGRRWHLRPSAAGARAAGPSLLLQVPADPADLGPQAPAGGGELNLYYDRLDLGAVSAAADDRLLALLGDARWLDSQPSSAVTSTPLVPLVSTWRIGWLAGMDPTEVGRRIDLLQWAGALAGVLPATAAVPAPSAAIPLQVHVPVRDMELTLAGLAADLERILEPLLAGGLAGAWQEVTAPGRDPAGTAAADAGVTVRSPSRLDLVLALAASRPREGDDRLGYRAPGGAWFTSRRLVAWSGDRERLAADLVHDLDAFAEWIRTRLEGSSRVDRGFVATLTEDHPGPELERRLLLGQELGFWTRGAPAPAGWRSLGAIHRLRETPVLDPESPAVGLVRGLATERETWRRRLFATPPGGIVAPQRVTTPAGTEQSARSWWRREGKDPLHAVRATVAAAATAVGPGRSILAGPFGSGRTELMLGALAATAEGRGASIWCPDRATAVRVHCAARILDRRWQPRIQVWRAGDPLPQRGATAPGERPLLALAELQRFPREIGYQLQEAGREGRILVTVDSVEVTGAREDLFLTTPRRDETHELRLQVLQARQPWRITRPLLPPGTTEQRSRRRDRGLVVSRRAGTLDECASAVAASAGSGRLGDLVALTAPLPDDVALLRRALADRGWAAVERDTLEDWLLPGVLELAAALADAHRRRHGAWPGSAGTKAVDRSGTLLGEFLDPVAAADWTAWLRALPDPVLDDAAAFLARLRRSPWNRVCCLRPLARERVGLLAASAAGAGPGDVLDPDLWQVWLRSVAPLLERPDLESGPPAVALSAAGAPAGAPAESVVYVCFGPEPAAVHRRVLSRATDRALVLYQEHSPLPGENESASGT